MGGEFYTDKMLAFWAVHGTSIFERITDLVHHILAKRGFIVQNYTDDLYACCHKDQAHLFFKTLAQVLQAVGLPINPTKLHPPCSRLSIMGIVVDIDAQTFSTEGEKLNEIYAECLQAFLAPVISK